MKKFELALDPNIARLAEKHFGERIFNEQIKPTIDYNIKNVIIFPDFVKNVSISFVQGFTKEILENISLAEFNRRFEILGNDKVVINFIKALHY